MISILLSFVLLLAVARGDTEREGIQFLREKSQEEGVISRKSGLLYRVLEETRPEGRQATLDSFVSVHYILKDIHGNVLTDSRKSKWPKRTYLNSTIQGWIEGVPLMKEGDRFEFFVPSELGYKDQTSGPSGSIPPNSVLVFEVELLEVNDSMQISDYVEFLFRNPVQTLIIGTAVFSVMKIFLGAFTIGDEFAILDELHDNSNPRAYLDIEVGDRFAGRIVVELFPKIAPKAVENFIGLCSGKNKKAKGGKVMNFRDSVFHRVIPGFMCQGGDTTKGDGTGGISIYGKKFKDEWENGIISHSTRGLLSMANSGPDTNGSQFFFTFNSAKHLDGRHVVFGFIESGMDTLKQMESVGSSSGITSETCKIIDCGIIVSS